VPPGTAGMAPTLSLDYSSQAGNGLVGLGWSLAGLPAITRCPRTLRQDGIHGTVNNDTDDRFCLDGQRLVVFNGGVYGGDGTEYRTEIDSYARITSHGNASGAPAWFQVQTRDGKVMQFGVTSDALIFAEGTPIPRAWALNRVTDSKGNYFTVTYVNNSFQAYPDHIIYTMNDAAGVGTAGSSSIWFYYEGRPDSVPAYRGGSRTQATVRLTSIQTYQAGALVSNYQLAYEQSPGTERSRLTSVQVCGGDGACLPSTTFGWRNVGQQFGLGNVVGTFGSGPEYGGMPNNTDYPRHVLDMNGDGLVDIVAFHLDEVFVLYGTGTSFSGAGAWGGCSFTVRCGGWPAQPTQFSPNWRDCFASMIRYGRQGCTSALYPRYVMDVNGDGLPDIIGINQHAVYVALSTGSSFDPASPWLICYLTPDCSFTDDNLYPRYVIDVNGDGLPDIVGFGANDVLVALNTGSGFSAPVSWLHCSFTYACVGWADNSSYPRYLADVNGDGLPDIVGFGGNDIFVSLNTGTGFASPQSWLYCQFTASCGGWPTDANVYPRHLIDVNGDGLPDIVAIGGDHIFVSLNTGRNFGGAQSWLYCSFTPLCGGWPNDSQYPRYFADVNGDGLPDIVGFGGDVQVSLNTGSSFTGAPPRWLTCSLTVCGGWTDVNTFPRYVIDINGDGRADIIGFGYFGTYIATADGSGFPDLIASITNGLGVVTSVTYRSLADPTFYQRDQGSRAVPIVDVTGAMAVVSQVDTSNGIGGTLSSSYSYAGARADIWGLGFLGFRQTGVTDLQTGINQVTTYRQDFPFVGLVSQAVKSVGASPLNSMATYYQVLNVANTSSVSNPTTGSAPYRVTLAQSFDQSWDLDGSVIPMLTTTYQYDGFGNPTQIVATADGASKTTANTYYNDVANWYLGRLIRAEVISSQP